MLNHWKYNACPIVDVVLSNWRKMPTVHGPTHAGTVKKLLSTNQITDKNSSKLKTTTCSQSACTGKLSILFMLISFNSFFSQFFIIIFLNYSRYNCKYYHKISEINKNIKMINWKKKKEKESERKLHRDLYQNWIAWDPIWLLCWHEDPMDHTHLQIP